MAIARSTGAFLGTDETTGVTIANNGTSAETQVDVLGDNASGAEMLVYLVFTSTVAVGTVDVTINRHRVSGAGYAQDTPTYSKPAINGTAKYCLGPARVARYMSATVKNNATGASLTNVAVLYELSKVS